MNRLKWDDLQVFLALHREGSLAAAGRAVGQSHTTAWRRIAALEEALGASLFTRTPEGYVLTEVGEELLPRALRIEDDVHAICRTALGTDAALSGPVKLTAPESLMPTLAPACSAFADRHPDIHVAIEVGDGFFDLSRRDADIAVRAALQPPVGAVGRRVGSLAWGVYGPPGLDLDASRALPWVGYTETLGHLAALGWYADWAESPIPAIRVSSVPAMASLLRTGGRCGLLPLFVGRAEPGLHAITGPLDRAESALWVLVHPDLRRTARVRAFADHLFAALRADREVFAGGPGD